MHHNISLCEKKKKKAKRNQKGEILVRFDVFPEDELKDSKFY